MRQHDMLTVNTPQRSRDLTMFINYSHPEQARDRRKTSQINAHISRSRKSIKTNALKRQPRPLQWRIRPQSTAEPKQTDSSCPGDMATLPPTQPPSELLIRALLSKSLPPHDLGGLRQDPFTAFPLPPSKLVVWAADYCEFLKSNVWFDISVFYA